ncbi:unnamed protein product [Pedinophyceae sp. YPF-701]|nr:unnamed protein product [Pedinophyceae sp. YPF-701]
MVPRAASLVLLWLLAVAAGVRGQSNIAVSFPSGQTLTEGGSFTFSLSLAKAIPVPAGDAEDTVTVQLRIKATNGEVCTTGQKVCELSIASLPSNYLFSSRGGVLAWNVPKNHTIPVAANFLVDRTRTYTAEFTLASTIPATFPLETRAFNLTVLDDDTAGLEVSTTSIALSEGPAGTTYNLRLTAAPFETLTVGFSPSTQTVFGRQYSLAFTPSTLSFTTANWNTFQAVQVTHPQDFDKSGNLALTIAHTLSGGSLDFAFTGYNTAPQNVAAAVTDIDTALVNVTATPVSVAEGSQTANAYRVTLSSRPYFDVIVRTRATCTSVRGSPCAYQALGTEGGEYLNLTSANWQTGVQATVVAVDNTFADDGASGTVEHWRVDSTDVNFNTSAPTLPTVSVTSTDNDTPGFVVDAGAGLDFTEGGSTSLTIRLLTTPYNPVTVSLGATDNFVNLSPPRVYWEAANWTNTATVTVNQADDDIDEGVRTSNVTLAASSSDADYTSITPLVPLTSRDNDVAGLVLTSTNTDFAALIAGSRTTPVQLIEGQTGVEIAVRLATRPRANTQVVVTLTVSSSQLTLPMGESLRFQGGNYNVPQTLRIDATDDILTDGNVMASVTVNVSAPLADYANTPSQSFLFTAVDNDDFAAVTNVDKWGGQLCQTNPCGQVAMSVPPGAFGAAGSNVALQEKAQPPASDDVANPAPPLADSRVPAVSGVYEFQPTGQRLEVPASLSLEYRPGLVNNLRSGAATVAGRRRLAQATPGEPVVYRKVTSPTEGWEVVTDAVYISSAGIIVVVTQDLGEFYVGFRPDSLKPAPVVVDTCALPGVAACCERSYVDGAFSVGEYALFLSVVLGVSGLIVGVFLAWLVWRLLRPRKAAASTQVMEKQVAYPELPEDGIEEVAFDPFSRDLDPFSGVEPDAARAAEEQPFHFHPTLGKLTGKHAPEYPAMHPAAYYASQGQVMHVMGNVGSSRKLFNVPKQSRPTRPPPPGPPEASTAARGPAPFDTRPAAGTTSFRKRAKRGPSRKDMQSSRVHPLLVEAAGAVDAGVDARGASEDLTNLRAAMGALDYVPSTVPSQRTKTEGARSDAGRYDNDSGLATEVGHPRSEAPSSYIEP